MATKPNKIRIIRLESIMNFENGKKVIINPNNHPFKEQSYFENQKHKVGRVREINDPFIGVRWKHGAPLRHYNYIYLKIID